jgi:hypothetical protein
LNQFEAWNSLRGLMYNQNTKDKDFQKGFWTVVFSPPYNVYTPKINKDSLKRS